LWDWWFSMTRQSQYSTCNPAVLWCGDQVKQGDNSITTEPLLKSGNQKPTALWRSEINTAGRCRNAKSNSTSLLTECFRTPNWRLWPLKRTGKSLRWLETE
jgi:hypothetical protein